MELHLISHAVPGAPADQGAPADHYAVPGAPVDQSFFTRRSS
jgi:hypothetical protein